MSVGGEECQGGGLQGRGKGRGCSFVRLVSFPRVYI